MDGQKQRNALTAAETTLRALAEGSVQRAQLNAGKAADLDQLGLFGALPAAVAAAVATIEAGTPLAAADWDGLRSAVPPGPLHALIESLMQ